MSRRWVVATLLWPLLLAPAAAAEPPAVGPPDAIGAAAQGCLQGAAALPPNGPFWQVLRPGHNRYWGHPALVAFIEEMAERERLRGSLLVGDMSLPRGGRMPSGHASHQTGLDADILFRRTDRPLTEAERDDPDFAAVIEGGRILPERFGEAQFQLLRAMASDPRVERIFVNPVIKRHLCQSSNGDRRWLQRIRPWWGHQAHFHVRLACPAGDAACDPGPAIAAGDGCGTELDWWFTADAALPAVKPAPPPAHYQPAMPSACKAILAGY